ncbi:hypothetical protein G4V62_06200 [Bacillaceae bacterium SIJ1]|nr:hypothetical protein [Litoribacterium kuwaitense]
MKKRVLWIAMLLVLSLVVVGCSGGEPANEEPTTEEEGTETETTEGTDDKEATTSSGENVVNYAIDANFAGIFEPAWQSSTIDSDATVFFQDSMFTFDENIQLQPNLASWTTEDELTYTFTINEGVTWHNGDPLIAEDWAYALETIAHPDYDGARYSMVSHVVGAEEKRSGEADSISGIEVVDERTINITFKEKLVNNLVNLWDTPMPSQYYEGIAVADLSSDPKVRQEPVGLGPFKVTEVREGEYIRYEKFDDYWQGTPKWMV